MLPVLQDVASRGDFAEIVPVSALRGTSLERLEALLVDRLPEQPAMFPTDQITDRSERFLAAELVREKLMRRLGDEVPYHLSVEVERFEASRDAAHIGAVIWVERPGQKGIVIGRQGRVLKSVGTDARKDMEALFGTHVHLELWVKVKKGWSDDERVLQRFGYRE